MTPADLRDKGFIEMPDGSFQKPSKAKVLSGEPAMLLRKSEIGAGVSRVCATVPDDIGGRSIAEATKNFSNENTQDCPKRVRAKHAKPAKRLSLAHPGIGEEACWHDAVERFEILFVVHAVRPCDWDGYDIKALQDFCVAVGIIPNDGWKTLSGRVMSKKVSTELEEKTEIFVTAIPAGQERVELTLRYDA